MKKIEKNFFWKKLKFWNPYGLRVSHIKFQQNRRQNFFFVSKGGPFGVFAIFKVSLCIRWSTLTDRNGQSDFLDCWNSGIKGCLNIKKIIWEQVLGAGMTFHWIIWLKTRADQKDPPQVTTSFQSPGGIGLMKNQRANIFFVMSWHSSCSDVSNNVNFS